MRLSAALGSSPRYLAFAAAVALGLCGAMQSAYATAYIFPGNLPAGCSGSAGNYSCGALTLVYNDTIAIATPTPATITINGNFSAQNAQINASGNAANLTLVVTGTFSMLSGTKVIANVTAGSVSDTEGNVTFGGNLATGSGAIQVYTSSSVAGSISSSSGAITLNQGNNVGGSVTSTSGNIGIGYQDVISGLVSTSGTVTLGQSAQVAGSITGAAGAISIGYAAQVTGAITSSSGTITFAQNAVASACVKSTGSATITLGPTTAVNSVCCGSSSCSNSCVVNNSTRTMPALCAAVVAPSLLARYDFDEAQWAGVSGEVLDSSGNGYNGTAAGLATTKPTTATASPAITGSPGTCGYGVFNRANKDYVALPSNLPNLATGSFTVTAWIRASNNALVGQRIFIDDEQGSGTATVGYGLSLGDAGTGTLRFYSRAATSAPTLDTANVITSGAWYFVAFGFDSAARKKQIYVTNAAGTVLSSVSAVISQSSLGTDTGISSIGGETNAAAGGENTASYGFGGNIDEVLVYQGALTTAQMDAVRTTTHACAVAGPNHLELRHGSGTGLTCTPSTLTVVACSDAACATPYTGGVTGTLTATGAGMTVNWPSGAPFAIASGSSSTTESMQVTTAGSVVLGASGISPAPAAATLCNFGSPSCTFTAADSGFVFNVANHVADVLQTPVSVSAVRKSDNSALCVPAFASVGKSVTFTCAYQNPASGSLPIRVGGSALNAGNSAAAACDATGRAVSLAFDATGLANTTVQYADVGQVQLNARYAGSGSSETGLVMTGADSFTTAPATFAFSAITAAPIKAGIAFAATATAVNNSGIATPNFGRESTPSTATLAFTRASPTGTGASNGAFSGSLGAFSAGVASASNLVWSEVGLGDLRATLTGGNYLASGLTVTGTTGTGGAVGRFIPHHFDVVVTPACSSFSYAAQPFTATVSAKNGLATPGITVNYDGSSNTTPSFAKAVILIDAPSLGVGSFGSTGTLAASAFSAGVATAAPAYSFTNKLTAAQTLVVRASDTDAVNSLGYAEGSTALRSGRLRLSNAFGSEKSALPMALQAEYWSGNDWVPNGADNCTSVPAAAVARSGYLDNKGAASAAWTTTASAIAVLAGSGTLTLSAPSPTLTGSVDLALNLGATTSDQSCLATHPASTGAALPWLRTQQGNCAATWDRDPAARASFGIYAPETRKTLYVRELY